MVVYLIKRKDPARALYGVRNEAAHAVGQLSSEKLFDDVSFKVGPGRACRAVKEEGSEAVVEVGVHKRPLISQRPHNAYRLDGLDRSDVRALPHRRLVGEKL